MAQLSDQALCRLTVAPPGRSLHGAASKAFCSSFAGHGALPSHLRTVTHAAVLFKESIHAHRPNHALIRQTS